MYNEVDTNIAKARYTTSLPTLISDFCYWSVLTGLVFGEGISFYQKHITPKGLYASAFIHQVARIYIFKEVVRTWGGGK